MSVVVCERCVCVRVCSVCRDVLCLCLSVIYFLYWYSDIVVLCGISSGCYFYLLPAVYYYKVISDAFFYF